MVEENSEFDKSHLAILSGHFHHLTPECLTERMGGEMLYVFQHILHLFGKYLSYSPNIFGEYIGYSPKIS